MFMSRMRATISLFNPINEFTPTVFDKINFDVSVYMVGFVLEYEFLKTQLNTAIIMAVPSVKMPLKCAL